MLALIPVLQGDQSPSYVTDSSASELEGMLVKQLLKSTDTTTVFVFSYRIFLVNNRLSHFVVFLSMLQWKQGVHTRGWWCFDSVTFRWSSFWQTSLDLFGSSGESCCAPHPPPGAEQCVVTLIFFYLLFCLAALYHMIWVQINHNGISESCLISDPGWKMHLIHFLYCK